MAFLLPSQGVPSGKLPGDKNKIMSSRLTCLQVGSESALPFNQEPCGSFRAGRKGLVGLPAGTSQEGRGWREAGSLQNREKAPANFRAGARMLHLTDPVRAGAGVRGCVCACAQEKGERERGRK